ncbi:Isocitrate dehydrogenase [NAD] subunit gamma, mitochondrial [Armadillidium nasatum]|uniref:Isocitrate dehydrogenase [NAD] subunit gamma, mitochondrial n=1 Tax=Armadillidium nasatum TaxID=96803 RepID=A0A5N5SJB2_9CRUS|nr:Isocitrate dehydrogenase [NAD] subunit gamma, mitochondrial [Armadillidium nasatum]
MAVRIIRTSSKLVQNILHKQIQPLVPAVSALQSAQRRTFSIVEAQKPNSPVLSKYGGRFTVTMIPGDGIGPELMGYVQEIFRYAGVPVNFEVIPLDFNHIEESHFKNAVIAIKRNGVAIKGSIESKYGEHADAVSRNVSLRTELDLFANVLHCKSYPSVRSRYKDIDIIIIRQNTEGEYSMLEHENVTGVVESMKIITRKASERLARYAFEYAKKHNRSKITCIHKANIMKIGDGLFLSSCREVSKDYPDIKFEDMIVDNTCMQLVARPQQFDVMLTPNLYGTVISNVICGLVGGAGLLSGRNYGDKFAVFEPGTRNTGTAIAGRNIANPVAMLNASCDLLEHLELENHANLIRSAIEQTLNEDQIQTSDIGGQSTSIDFVQNPSHRYGFFVQV